MTPIEWVLGICATLGAAFLMALVGIGWKSRETLVKMGAEFTAFKAEVRTEFGHVREDIQRAIPFENRLSSVERTAGVFDEAFADYKPWRSKVDEKIEGLDRRVGRIEDRQETKT